jgi:hypothetical protein
MYLVPVLKRAKRVMLLTGTPIQARIEDLYNLI